MLNQLSFANTLTVIFVFLKSILSPRFSCMVEFFCQKQQPSVSWPILPMSPKYFYYFIYGVQLFLQISIKLTVPLKAMKNSFSFSEYYI